MWRSPPSLKKAGSYFLLKQASVRNAVENHHPLCIEGTLTTNSITGLVSKFIFLLSNDDEEVPLIIKTNRPHNSLRTCVRRVEEHVYCLSRVLLFIVCCDRNAMLLARCCQFEKWRVVSVHVLNGSVLSEDFVISSFNKQFTHLLTHSQRQRHSRLQTGA